MRVAISLLVLLLSVCGVQTESHGTDASTELKELRDMVVELRVTLRHTRDDVKVLEADNVAMKQRLAVSESKVQVLEDENKAVKERMAASESKVEALERALQDTKVEMKTEVENLKKENATQEAELTAVKTRLTATETEVENLEKEIRAAPKVAFSAALGSGYTQAGDNDLNLEFKRVITNVGEAYSSSTGFFTAPVRGVYYFRFTVMDPLDSRIMDIRMCKNGEQLMKLYEYDTDGGATYLSSGLALQLEKGDTVNMVLPAGSRLKDNADNHSTFSGFLLFPL
ncbi:complement C1q-like protein 2 [Engraulis encrasicolus]|uniref:complement C1q-like protein 2 n=1 Tax=Engraulis encrasicolus TaxID=184585 RepID=UPI002FD4C02C